GVASGYFSLVTNRYATAESYAQTTVGSYNLPKGGETASSWVGTDPLFVVGNGTAAGASRSTALMILKNGQIGIGITTPSAALDVNGSAKFRGGLNTAVRVITAAGAVTVTTADYIICLNKTVGAATAVNLPASPGVGDQYVIKDCKGDANTNNITVTPNAGNIDGAATYIMNIARQSVGIFYDGTQWQVF
ncbi:MAG: hypothetical protein ACXVA9_11355, partial [Bdellovibrionales bacterium]